MIRHDVLLKVLFVVAIILFVLSILSATIITIDINPKLSLSYNGMNTFYHLFDIPIKLFAAAIVMLTLYLTIYRSIKYDEQVELNRHHLRMNNYYRHLDEFIKMMSQYQTANELFGTRRIEKEENFFRNLYVLWFGSEYETYNKIGNDFVEKANAYINYLASICYEDVKPEVSEVVGYFEYLGFEEKLKDSVISIQSKVFCPEIDDSLKIIFQIFKFSNDIDKIENLELLCDRKLC